MDAKKIKNNIYNTNTFNTIDAVNVRVKYNGVGVLYLTSGQRKKHIKSYDIIDKSKAYKSSVKIANTYNKTYYVKYNDKIIKLKSLKAILKHNKQNFFISNDYKYITIFENNKSYTSYKITYTNKCIVNNNTKDNTLNRKLYNY